MFEDFTMTMEQEAGAPPHIQPVAVGFGLYPLEDEKETAKRGTKYYRDVEFFRCITPGDSKAVVMQPATPAHKLRFPKAYAAFKANDMTALEGTPLQHWAMLSRSQVYNFKAMGIHTVQALAAVHDGHVDNLGSDGRKLRSEAQAWLAVTADTAAAQKLAAEKEQMAATIAQLQAQIVELANRVDNKTAKKAA